MRHLLITLSLFLIFPSAFAQQKHEVRAAWITTAYALDWPKSKANTPAGIRQQKEELIAILDKLYAANFNTILFQARTRGDVFYPSSIEPFSAMLTGTVGKNPGYDPLAFAIEECHKRGMECHAWMVGIPLGSAAQVRGLGKESVTRKQPGICVQHKKQWYLNPGTPGTKQYLMQLAQEIVTRYDIDGIHLDYLRYPENEPKFPDRKEFLRYGKGKKLDEWRRDNLTEIVRYIYKGIKDRKPWVKFSSSPVGRYRNTARYQSNIWSAYHTVYQDVQKWLAEGIVDQIYPMMYFRGNNFYPYALDWQERSNGRHIIPGLGIYFLDPKEGNWTREEIERQIYFIRNNGLAGQAYYRVGFLMNNTQGLYDELNEQFYIHQALQPPMPWINNTPPTTPTDLKMSVQGGYTTLTWNASTDDDEQNEPYYIIYGSNSYPVDISNPEHIIAQRIKKNSYVHAPIYFWEACKYFAVTAVDRYGNESEAVQLESR
ncbi:glycoside hydrolase family 10 protein [Bacteroides sp. 51]|uniref:glycoside hydrolase family 10 protein n=1 Tax=Bacteroides sp. 51 TaxID=2302938 RepID=UPI0013D44A0B|nr:family 10 glycosylhydrolase [Bacteroides sp. 51]NDV82804.1 S-layer protein [Bacteroides sp. 51]